MDQLLSFLRISAVYLAVSALTAVFAQAQEVAGGIPISGYLTDGETDEPLIGATVAVRGSGTGTTTDIDGRFELSAGSEQDVLVFSYVGYVDAEQEIGQRREFAVAMLPGGVDLDEVVVTGYGSSKKGDLTGSAVVLQQADLNQGIYNSPEQLLQGRVSGVNVVSASGEPGSAQQINVRGPGGLRSGSTPLFVLDGLALDNGGTGAATNPLNFINPEDIESISVLKDASATAIYGARGANGVILITTKRGKSGQAQLAYSGNVGLSRLARSIDLLGRTEFLEAVNDAGGTPEDFGADTDWQDEVTRTAVTQRHNLSLSGGAGDLSYYASFGLQEQEGILQNSGLDIYSGRINATQRFWDGRLTVEANLNATRTENLRPPTNAVVETALTINPTYPAYAADGGINVFQGVFVNPLLLYGVNKDIAKTNRILGSITPSLTIVDGLVYKLNVGVDQSNAVRDIQSQRSDVPRQDGRLDTYVFENSNRLIENYLTYTSSRPGFELTALAGHSYQRFRIADRNYSIGQFPFTDIEPINNPGIGQQLDLQSNRPSGSAVVNELQSFFGRANVSLRERYLFTATLRADGSSKFGDNNKYGYFPSFSGGWRISEEPFFGESDVSLKLRAGWGQTGNQEIPSKITQPLFTSTVSGETSYPLDDGETYPVGITYTRLANPDIQWEVSQQTNVGLDLGLMNGAFVATLDYFDKTTTNILLEVIPADPVQPATSYWTNVPDMEIRNQGLEVGLDYRLAGASGFTMDLVGNLTLIRNEVANSPYSVIPSGAASGSGLTSATINGYVNDEPIGTFFLQDFTGFDESGMSTYRDVNGDGEVNDGDRIAAGTALPTRLYNFSTRFGFRGIGLSANFNGVSGNKVYDNTANANFYKLRLSRGLNVTPEAISTPEESVNNAAPVSTRFLKDGAFLRLNNLTLDYNLDTEALGFGKYLSGLSFYLTGQNLFVVTDYDGFDPEVNTDRTIDGVVSYGIDYLSYPKARTLILGTNVRF